MGNERIAAKATTGSQLGFRNALPALRAGNRIHSWGQQRSHDGGLRGSNDRRHDRWCSEPQSTWDGGFRSIQIRADDSSELSPAPPIVREVLASPGIPLDSTIRSIMESRFAHGFSRVRIHTDARANESAKAVNAVAYSIGNRVVFGAGAFQSGRRNGRQLLAHELAHVVQQEQTGIVGVYRQTTPLEQFDPRSLGDKELAEEYQRIAIESDPDTEDYRSALEGEMQRRGEARQRLAERARLSRLLVEWSEAGLLEPPFRPRFVGPIPPLPITPEEARAFQVPIVIARAAPRLAPEAPVFEPRVAPTRPPLRLVPPEAPAPRGVFVGGRAVGLGVAVFLLVWLYPRSTAPPWMDEMNPISGAPYNSPGEYEWVHSLGSQRQAYLRWLVEARRLAPNPTVETDPDPSNVPSPHPEPAPRPKEGRPPCFSSEIPRRGGHRRHDAYATRVTGSTSDFLVIPPSGGPIAYDGRTLNTPRVWEVKVGFGWFFNPGYRSLRDITLARFESQKNRGLVAALLCALVHLWSTPSPWVAELLNNLWGGLPPVMDIPE